MRKKNLAAVAATALDLDRHSRGGILRDIASLSVPFAPSAFHKTLLADGVVRVSVDGAGMRILYLTDLHLTAGYFTYRKDRAAIRDVCALVSASRPDLIVLGGDFVSPILWRSFTRDSLAQARAVGALMARIGIPWTFVLGNHERDGRADEEALVETLSTFPNCIANFAPYIGGYNSLFVLEGKSGRHLLFLLDTHRKSRGQWGCVKSDQTNWYREKVRAFQREGVLAPSTVLCHIPPAVFQRVHSDIARGEGVCLFGSGDGTGRIPIAEGGFYDTFKANGGRILLCGHHHFNSRAILRDGIVHAYNPSMDHSVYPCSHRRIDHLGGTLLTVGGDASVRLQQYRCRICQNERAFYTKNDGVTVCSQ